MTRQPVDRALRLWSRLPPTARGALGACAVFLAGTGLTLSGVSTTLTDRGEQVSLSVRLSVLALLCLTLLFRRRAPVWAMVFGLIPLGLDLWFGPTVTVWVIYCDLIYAAVLYSGLRASRVVLASWVALSVLLVLATLPTGDGRIISFALLTVLLFVATPLWWAMTVRTHKEIAGAERARAQALTLVADLDRRAAIADERTTMARDLHDVIAGHLSAIAIQSEAVLGVLAKRAADAQVDGIIHSIRANSVSALQEMRTMIGLLQDDSGAAAHAEAGAPRRLAQLPQLVDAARSAGISVRVATDTDLEHTALPSAVDQAAYRIVQEALTNAMKHAPGHRVTISVRLDGSVLRVWVWNSTSGPKADTAESSDRPRGLINMRERAAALGGSFTAGHDARGWEVCAELPVRVGAA